MMKWFQTKLSDAQKKKMSGRDEGFTLVELLVVILIIGVLSGIVVLAVSNSTDDAKAKTCTQNAVNLLAALDTYKATSTTLGGGEGKYMAPSAVSGTGDFANFKSVDATALATALVPKFIKSIPPNMTAYVTTDRQAAAVGGTGDCAAAKQGV